MQNSAGLHRSITQYQYIIGLHKPLLTVMLDKMKVDYEQLVIYPIMPNMQLVLIWKFYCEATVLGLKLQ